MISIAPLRVQYQSLFRQVRVPSQNLQGSPAAAKIEWRPDLVRVAFSFRRVCFGAGPFSDLRAARVMVLYFSTDLLQQVFFSRDRQVGVLLLCGDGKPGSPAVVGDKV